jgi:hypothetical protein
MKQRIETFDLRIPLPRKHPVKALPVQVRLFCNGRYPAMRGGNILKRQEKHRAVSVLDGRIKICRRFNGVF